MLIFIKYTSNIFEGLSLKCWKCEMSENTFDKECLQKPPAFTGSSFQPKGYTEEVCANSSFTCGKGHFGKCQS